MDLSIVIPAYNERESLPELLENITKAVQPLGLKYEIIVVDDGSNDGTFEVLKSLKESHPPLKVLSFRKNYGKSPGVIGRIQSLPGKAGNYDGRRLAG